MRCCATASAPRSSPGARRRSCPARRAPAARSRRSSIPPNTAEQIGSVIAADAATVDAAIDAAVARAGRLGRRRRRAARGDPRARRDAVRGADRGAGRALRARGGQDAARCHRRSARGRGFPALLRGARAPRFLARVDAAGTHRRAQPAAPARQGRVRLHQSRGISRWLSTRARWPRRSPPATPWSPSPPSRRR